MGVALRQLGTANTDSAKSIEKLSSGYRINRAGDDAAGLAISEKMRGQIRGLNQASSNAQDGISLIQTTEGALNETHAILQRMRELAVQSSTDTNTDTDRGNLQDEMDQLSEEITRIAETTEFNTMKLLDGSFEGKKFHIGANQDQNISIDVNNMTSKALELVGERTDRSADITAAGITVIAKEGTKVDIEFTEGTDGDPIAVTKSATGKLSVTYGKDTITLEDLNAALKEYGVEVEATSTANTIDWTALTTETAKAGDFKQAEVTVAGTDITITNEKIKEIEILVDPNATTSATLNDQGKLVITLDGTDTGLNGDADEINAFLAAQGIEGIEFGDVAAAGDAKAADVVFETKTEGTAVKAETNINISTQGNADKAISTINNALETVSKERSKLGAIQNRLEHTIKNLDTSAENLQASESRIRDVDMAKEMMEQTKQNILAQASTAMLAQANQAPQAVLQLLR